MTSIFRAHRPITEREYDTMVIKDTVIKVNRETMLHGTYILETKQR